MSTANRFLRYVQRPLVAVRCRSIEFIADLQQRLSASVLKCLKRTFTSQPSLLLNCVQLPPSMAMICGDVSLLMQVAQTPPFAGEHRSPPTIRRRIHFSQPGKHSGCRSWSKLFQRLDTFLAQLLAVLHGCSMGERQSHRFHHPSPSFASAHQPRLR